MKRFGDWNKYKRLITEWKVNKGDEIVEITMGKAKNILTAYIPGVIEDILFNVGDTVEVGSVACRINEK